MSGITRDNDKWFQSCDGVVDKNLLPTNTFQWLLTCPICITVFDYLIEFVNGNFTSGSKRKFPKYRSTENSITRLLNQLADLLFINLSNNTCVKDEHLKIRKSILQEIKSYKVINIAGIPY